MKSRAITPDNSVLFLQALQVTLLGIVVEYILTDKVPSPSTLDLGEKRVEPYSKASSCGVYEREGGEGGREGGKREGGRGGRERGREGGREGGGRVGGREGERERGKEGGPRNLRGRKGLTVY